MCEWVSPTRCCCLSLSSSWTYLSELAHVRSCTCAHTEPDVLHYLQGFDLQAEGPWFWIEGVIDIFFYADLVMNFLTAYEVRMPPSAPTRSLPLDTPVVAHGTMPARLHMCMRLSCPLSPTAACHTPHTMPHLSVATTQHPITGELVTSHKMIAARYLSSWFWIDLLATFPSDYIVKGLQVRGGDWHRVDGQELRLHMFKPAA